MVLGSAPPVTEGRGARTNSRRIKRSTTKTCGNIKDEPTAKAARVRSGVCRLTLARAPLGQREEGSGAGGVAENRADRSSCVRPGEGGGLDLRLTTWCWVLKDVVRVRHFCARPRYWTVKGTLEKIVCGCTESPIFVVNGRGGRGLDTRVTTWCWF